jgi:hypothetical protein
VGETAAVEPARESHDMGFRRSRYADMKQTRNAKLLVVINSAQQMGVVLLDIASRVVAFHCYVTTALLVVIHAAQQARFAVMHRSTYAVQLVR